MPTVRPAASVVLVMVSMAVLSVSFPTGADTAFADRRISGALTHS